jgi:hypothetical protein
MWVRHLMILCLASCARPLIDKRLSALAAAEKHLSYEPCDDLWIVTAYFNPCGYRSRRANYAAFSEPIRASGLNLVTIECAFGDDAFNLQPGPDVIQVRGRDVLWQKERLLNIAISRLPARAAKVVWLDCDVLFANASWARETSRLSSSPLRASRVWAPGGPRRRIRPRPSRVLARSGRGTAALRNGAGSSTGTQGMAGRFGVP